MNKLNGLLVVLSSPSGGGKTTVIKAIKKDDSHYIYSVSMTTRPPRQGEVDGRDYWFVKQDEFQRKINNDELIEYEKVHDWFYGTPKEPIQKWLEQGKIVLLDLDVLGALRLKEQLGDDVLLIFLRPPNEDVLIQRLKKRSTESEAQINRRLERVHLEMSKADDFDVIVVNDDLQDTIKNVKKIINEHRNTTFH
jgi:guanylate kinase